MRIRLANPPAGLVAKYTKTEQAFFTDYARSVLKLVSRPEVHRLLEELINKEGIRSDQVIDLRVMMFPAMPLNGRPRSILHGSYNHDEAQISLYPLKIPRVWIRKTGYEFFRIPLEELNMDGQRLLGQIQLSSLSTLIHEVLHVKFGSSQISRYAEEAIVRKLEKSYMREWESELRTLLAA